MIYYLCRIGCYVVCFLSDTMSPKEMLYVRLNGLKQNHGDLDLAIEALDNINTSDQLSVRRLKKEKLKVKDEIKRLKEKLTPDIIA